MSNIYKINFDDTEHTHSIKSSSPHSDNYYLSNYEHDAKFAVDVTFDEHSGEFFIVYLKNGATEYSPKISLDHNEIRDFKATVGVSPKIALERMIALHDKKVKTVRLVIWNKDDERTLLDFDRRLAATYLTICKDFSDSELSYENVREAIQSIVDTEHYRFSSKSELNLTPQDQEGLTYLLTDEILAKFRELKYK